MTMTKMTMKTTAMTMMMKQCKRGSWPKQCHNFWNWSSTPAAVKITALSSIIALLHYCSFALLLCFALLFPIVLCLALLFSFAVLHYCLAQLFCITVSHYCYPLHALLFSISVWHDYFASLHCFGTSKIQCIGDITHLNAVTAMYCLTHHRRGGLESSQPGWLCFVFLFSSFFLLHCYLHCCLHCCLHFFALLFAFFLHSFALLFCISFVNSVQWLEQSVVERARFSFPTG